jgi:hypothetical protein
MNGEKQCHVNLKNLSRKRKELCEKLKALVEKPDSELHFHILTRDFLNDRNTINDAVDNAKRGIFCNPKPIPAPKPAEESDEKDGGSHQDFMRKLRPDDRVLLHGLIRSPKSNGIEGTLKTWDAKRNGWVVKLDNKREMLVPPENLILKLDENDGGSHQGLRPQDRVQLHSLTTKKHNGKYGKLQTWNSNKRGRWVVRLERDSKFKGKVLELSLQPKNLRLVHRKVLTFTAVGNDGVKHVFPTIDAVIIMGKSFVYQETQREAFVTRYYAIHFDLATITGIKENTKLGSVEFDGKASRCRTIKGNMELLKAVRKSSMHFEIRTAGGTKSIISYLNRKTGDQMHDSSDSSASAMSMASVSFNDI